ncbi:MAG: hypothetical protein EOO39_25300 [Cytophagaceae bacterium]|nr:MAG: hypothetical protein EOO39_25300 [Cytophagaceae bacterium]
MTNRNLPKPDDIGLSTSMSGDLPPYYETCLAVGRSHIRLTNATVTAAIVCANNNQLVVVETVGSPAVCLNRLLNICENVV